jgi:uncharacterized protein (UPF0332 family)
LIVLDPADFLHVANELVAGSRSEALTPARVRTAVGRAYYAVFLLIRAELSRRHRVPLRRIQHGSVYTHLQSPRAGDELRHAGRELERLYAARQKADYDLAPDAFWRRHVEDPSAARILLRSAGKLAQAIPRLDLSPIAPLF